ncbi:MAG: hypothetical protein II876_01560, partial [Synergistaceae bacterium]|nr:hypothetical protein [Synergistaceae bacterium]
MNRKIIEQYLGRSVEIMLMPDGRKTSGVVLRCEDDFFALGNATGDEAIYVYPIVWGINPVAAQNPPSVSVAQVAVPIPIPVPSPVQVMPAPAVEPKTAVPSVPVQVEAVHTEPVQKSEPEHSFAEELEACYDELDARADEYILNAEYVRKFKRDRMDKIQNTLESILTKYGYAVSVKEDRPYSMRMRQILDEAKALWRTNQSNIAACEIYGFVLYLMGENTKSVK